MKLVKGNLWQQPTSHWVGITTNGSLNQAGKAIMGRGTALQAKQKYPDLPQELAERIDLYGNRVYMFCQYRLFTFPVKYMWNELANLKLIQRSADQLRDLIIALGPNNRYILPKPGCGAGQRTWKEVLPYLSSLENLSEISIIDL